MATAIAGMVFEAWADLDRAVADLSAADAERRIGVASPISWTVAHCTHMVDSWLNVRLQGKEPHPLMNGDALRAGTPGDPLDWDDVQLAVHQVRESAKEYLQSLSEEMLETKVAYTGSVERLRATGMSPRYAAIHIAAHHYFHIGEIASSRSSLGHDVGDYPGLMAATL